MYLQTISSIRFDEFAKKHPLGSFHQSSNYANYAKTKGYDYEYIGLFDKENTLLAASLILIKKVNFLIKYGYAPKGFLIDYNNQEVVQTFTTLLKKYYFSKNMAFIKINPEIVVGNLNFKTKKVIYNKNRDIEKHLLRLDYIKIQANYFETKIPRFNAILLLKNTNLKTINKNTRNKINKSKKNGLTLIKGNLNSLNSIYKFIEKKKSKTITQYLNYYNAFNKTNEIDTFLVQVDFEKFLINYREKYEQELEKNKKLVEKLMKEQTEINLKKKLESDKNLSNFKDYINKATKLLAKKKEDFIASAITIKYQNRVHILISGYNKEFQSLCPNYFLHYSLIEYYKKDFDFLELNGLTGDFSENNPYKGLNEFKMGFNPIAVEYIGEFDLIINKGLYDLLNKKGLLKKEFKRKEKVLFTQE